MQLLHLLLQSPPPLLNINAFATDIPIVVISGHTGVTYGVVDPILTPYNGQDIKVVIEDCNIIAQWAFSGYDNIVEITISDGLTNIQNEAFMRCGFRSITLPDSVVAVGEGTFKECESLVSVKLPSSLEYINNYMFSGCTELKYITLPDNLIQIGEGAFTGCTNMSEVVVPRSVTDIKVSAFRSWVSEQTIYMEHDDPSQLVWENPPTEPTIVWGYKPPVAGTSNSTTPLNVNLRKTVIDISQPTFLSLVINPNTVGLEVISDDYYIQSNNNCPIQVSLVDFGLSEADDSGYQLVAPTAKTWADVPHTEKVLALGIKHNKASELSNGVELIDGDTFWSTDIDEPVAVCQIAAKKRATFELIAQHGYSVDDDRTLTVEIVPVITLATV